MPVTASGLFDFMERHPVCVIDRREIDMPEFGILRRNMGQMIVRLRESEEPEAHELSDGLRCLLSGWLTAPIPFDDSIREKLSIVMGTEERVGARWGRDIRAFHIAALQAGRDLVGKANPLRETLQEIVAETIAAHKDFRIFCHRTALAYFLPFVPANAFIHSAAGYRDAQPFDLLIKVGPLRSRGWGSAPDALLSAPRFSRLALLVWAGCADEEGFGYDPVVALESAGQKGIVSSPQRREVTVSRTGASAGPEYGVALDEFQIFSAMKERSEVRQAMLVQLEDESGILYPPLSHVISFDPSPGAEEPIARRLVDGNLCDGMFLVRHAVHGQGGGDVHAEHGYFSRIWKDRLEQELSRNPDAFCRKLREAGIDLAGLYGAARHWAKSPTTVVHAPQKRSHFEILIRELGIERVLPGDDANPGRGVWWQRAWREVVGSRGVAIQAGVQGHETLEEELLGALIQTLPEIRHLAAQAGSSFTMTLPESVGLSGVVFFDRIVSIEPGFKVPENELRVLLEMGKFEQWRA